MIPAVRLSSRGSARVRAGHPWIFRGDVADDSAPPSADEVQLLDERGRPIASALRAAAPAALALRVYARGPTHLSFDQVWPDRLGRAAARRRALYGDDARICRIVHGEGDQLPGLFVDRWGDAAVVQSATAAVDRREGAIATRLRDLLGLRLVVARNDGSLRDHEALPRRKGVLVGDGPALVRVREGEAVLELDLLEDRKTGGYLDQRENHLHVAGLARGEVLDAFTYHGGFALALARRASHVLAYDEDARAVARARRNAELSDLHNVEVEVADAFAALRELERTGRRFQMVVLDPPALSKRRAAPDAAARAYKELNLRALRLLERDGWLVTCSCSGKMTPALFGQMLVEAARDAGREATIVERRGAARDHPVLVGVPETDYLKCWIVQAL